MTDEEKKVEIIEQKEEKKCCCCKLFCKFLMITSAVFTGTLLALLVAKALTQPQFPPCPCAMKGYRPGFERQLPSQQMGERVMHGHHFRGERAKFEPDKMPQNPENKD